MDEDKKQPGRPEQPVETPKTSRSAEDLPPGSIFYLMRELDREPDEKIAALKAQWRALNDKLWECAQKRDPEIEQIRTRLNECGKELDKLHRAPDRVRRLLQLRGSIAFSEWLAREKRPAPTILRDGVAVPPAEQDGYYQQNYDEWRKMGSPCGVVPGKQDLRIREEDGVWYAELTIHTSAIGRSKYLAERNARSKAEMLVKTGNAHADVSNPLIQALHYACS
jgi:hypothetical protein